MGRNSIPSAALPPTPPLLLLHWQDRQSWMWVQVPPVACHHSEYYCRVSLAGAAHQRVECLFIFSGWWHCCGRTPLHSSSCAVKLNGWNVMSKFHFNLSILGLLKLIIAPLRRVQDHWMQENLPRHGPVLLGYYWQPSLIHCVAFECPEWYWVILQRRGGGPGIKRWGS